MNQNGSTVHVHQAFKQATPEHSDRHHRYFDNELRLINDLAMAREVQQQLLRREIRNISGIDLATACVPARELGGDFYDVLPYANGCVAFALGDVSGKGTAAALLGALTMGILRAHTVDHTDSPSEVLAALNRRLHAARLESRFVVMLFAVLDAGSRQITLGNSGTPYPLLLRSGNVKEIAVSGIPLGLVKDSRYDSLSVDLQRGDIIAFASDGIVECHNKKLEAFGASRLASVLTSSSSDSSAQDVASAILDATDEFRRGAFAPDDDRSVIVLKVTDDSCTVFSRLPVIY